MIGIKISKDGYTVKDDDQFQYVNTDTPLFKLYLSNSGSRIYSGQTFPAGSPDTIIIPHNLGYEPMNFVYMDRDVDAKRRIVSGIDTQFASTDIIVITQVDSQNLYIYITSPYSTPTSPQPITGEYGYNYQIYYDEIAE